MSVSPTVTPPRRRRHRRLSGSRRAVVTDLRSEIRDFLRTRRARITPAQAGLPAYGGNRRTTSWKPITAGSKPGCGQRAG
jgi:hypothetical protein